MKNQSTEDYLKGILKLETGGRAVTTSALARHLGIGDGSVTDMVKKLAERDLIRYVPYRGMTLTENGRRIAVTMMRRHRLWEIFLTRHLGYRWDEVHDEAEHLEHATSDELERRLSAMLGHPDTDPHGEPVPRADGSLAVTEDLSVAEFPAGSTVKVTRVSDGNSAVLQHVSKIGISLGKRLTIREKRDFDGSLVVVVSKRETILSREVAGSIFGKPS